MEGHKHPEIAKAASDHAGVSSPRFWSASASVNAHSRTLRLTRVSFIHFAPPPPPRFLPFFLLTRT